MRQFADDACAAAGWNLGRAPWAWVVGLNVFWITVAEWWVANDAALAAAAGVLSGGILAGAGRRFPRWTLIAVCAAFAAPFIYHKTYWTVEVAVPVLGALLASREKPPAMWTAVAWMAAAPIVASLATLFDSPGHWDQALYHQRSALLHAAEGMGALGILQLARNGHSLRHGVVLVSAYAMWLLLLEGGLDSGLASRLAITFHIPPLLFAAGRIAEAARTRAEHGEAAADRATAWMLGNPWRTAALVVVAAVLVDRWAPPWKGSLWMLADASSAVVPGPALLGVAFLFHLARGSGTLLGKASALAAVVALQAVHLATYGLPDARAAGGDWGDLLELDVVWLLPWTPLVAGWIVGRRPAHQGLDALDGFLTLTLLPLSFWLVGRGAYPVYPVGASVVALLLFHRLVSTDIPLHRLVLIGAVFGAAAAVAAVLALAERQDDFVYPVVVFAARGAVAGLFVAVTRRVRSMTTIPDDHPAFDARPD